MPVTRLRDGGQSAFVGRGDHRLVFIHANGFCKEVWDPVIEELPDVGYLTLDQPGHGGSSTPDPPFDWWQFSRAALEVIDDAGAERPIGIGHSSGAATLAMAEIVRSGTFERLVLVEPVLPPPPYRRIDQHPLIAGALRRTRSFPTSDAAFASYHGRGPFAHWDDRALRAYVEHGFVADDDGWSLRCAPETEAEVYRTSEAHAAWERLGEIECPVDIVLGSESDTMSPESAVRLTGRFTVGRLEVVEGASHFVPMERPAAVAELIPI